MRNEQRVTLIKFTPEFIHYLYAETESDLEIEMTMKLIVFHLCLSDCLTF